MLSAMLLYCGIDEAGYGPLLGPLCVAGAVFAIDGADGAAVDVRPPDLWTLLRSAVADRPGVRDRIAIADSKRLKGAKVGKAHPLRHLERGVLAALVSAGRNPPATDAALVEALGVALGSFEACPWYARPVELPLGDSAEALAIAGNRLSVACRGSGVRLARLACRILDGPDFNREARRCRKSELNFRLAMDLVDAIWTDHAGAHPRVVVDRQGGRAQYLEVLGMVFPDASRRVLGETDSTSRYRLEDARGPITLSFEVESESRHLPCALASMTAKLVRELLMERLNRYFRDLLPALAPTAGYVEDGRRFLAEIRPTLRRLGIAEEHLVRSR
jgi:hypothetical protein